VARLIAREVEKRGLLDDYPEVDGVIRWCMAMAADGQQRRRL